MSTIHLWRAIEYLENTTIYDLSSIYHAIAHTPSLPHTLTSLHQNSPLNCTEGTHLSPLPSSHQTHQQRAYTHPHTLAPSHQTHRYAAQRAHAQLHQRMVEFVTGVAGDTVGQDGCHDEGKDGGTGHASDDRTKQHSAVRGKREAILLQLGCAGTSGCTHLPTCHNAVSTEKARYQPANKPASVNKTIYRHKDPFGCSG